MASFQRMLQEPKSKQNKLSLYYKLTVLNHTFLSSTASLGTYTQSNPTTAASDAFNRTIAKVISKLDMAILLLKSAQNNTDEVENTQELHANVEDLNAIKNGQMAVSLSQEEMQDHEKIQEVQLVIEQLTWLTNLSENIVKTTERVLKE
jgi:hypothetical protein